MKKKMPLDPSTIKKLEQWLSKPNNSCAKIAAAFSYKSSQTIQRWIERGRVPDREKEKVIAYIKEN